MSSLKTMKKWSEFTTVDEAWIDECLIDHGVEEEKKLKVRTFSIPFSGTTYNTSQFVDFIAESIESFVLSPQKIKELKQKKRNTWREAARYFGHTDPEKDGKYGELILYLFTEAVLKTPIISYKLPLLTNTKDQGVSKMFVGEILRIPR
ncbi:Hachiman antiphage defense system protein HamA [Bacillus smithii]|uniref:Hachiman antiphage defense system protein HamA n=1 Tax=Bacillus smithii TaxID=1479 RepID=UPI003D1E3FE5